MVFSSTVFLFAFLPAFLALYFLCPGRAMKNTWLLAASLVFYAWGEPVYVALMIVSILANWLFGLMVGRKVGSGGGSLTAAHLADNLSGVQPGCYRLL